MYRGDRQTDILFPHPPTSETETYMSCHNSREVKLFKLPWRKLGKAFEKDLRVQEDFPG